MNWYRFFEIVLVSTLGMVAVGTDSPHLLVFVVALAAFYGFIDKSK